MKKYIILLMMNNEQQADELKHVLQPFLSHFELAIINECSDESLRSALDDYAKKQQEIALFIYEYNMHLGYLNDCIVVNFQNSTTSASKIILLLENQHLNLIDEAVANTQKYSDYCLYQPYLESDFQPLVKEALTDFILKYEPVNCLQYSELLNKDRILKAYIERNMAQFRASFLPKNPNLSHQELIQELIDRLYMYFKKSDRSDACQSYESNHILLEEGNLNAYLWIIISGEIVFYKKNEEGVSCEVSRNKTGSVIGSMSFISGEPTLYTSVTSMKTEVIKIDHQLFDEIISYPNEISLLFNMLLIRQSNQRLRDSIYSEIQLKKTLESLNDVHQQLIEREKMAMLGDLVAGVAHEINNPIAAILSSIQTIQHALMQLISEELEPNVKSQGIAIMQSAINKSNKLNTQEVRQRAKQITNILPDYNLAKLAVQMGLDQEPLNDTCLSVAPAQLAKNLTQWQSFYDVGHFLRTANVSAQRIAGLVKSLKTYARPETENMEYADIHQSIEDTLLILEAKLRPFHVQKQFSNLPKIYCQPHILQQVWVNLLTNAIDAIDPVKGAINIVTRFASNSHQKMIEVIIEDNGTGIPEEIHEKIFELNFTTKREGNFGLGIGLSISSQIVAQHFGKIRVESELGKYTRMIVALPVNHKH